MAKLTRNQIQKQQLAARTAKANAINAFITSNKKFLKQGCTFDAAWLDANLAWLVPNLSKNNPPMKQAITRVAAYTTLNKAMAQRGLYIKSSNYYETFTVLDLAATTARANGYAKVARTKASAGTFLDTNIKTFKCKWTKLNSKVEIPRLAAKLKW